MPIQDFSEIANPAELGVKYKNLEENNIEK